jgi:hypothetical protein
LSLGLAVVFSPFLGGAFALIYGLTAVWCALRNGRNAIGTLITTTPAVIPVIAALGWCVASGTFDGAGGAASIGLSRLAKAAPFSAPALALGPLLAVAIPAVVVGRRWRIETATIALLVGLCMLYLVTLTTEPIWVGWRAGQVLLVTLPALAAVTVGILIERCRRAVTWTTLVVAFSVGLPTSAIDLHNAQDVNNTEMGPGFRWTVIVPRDTQAAVEWIRRNTPSDAIVQMSIGPRGRETWTLIPTFAQRRMAAGRPISLLWTREYDERSALADAMFGAANPAEASRIARSLRIDFIYLDAVERGTFGETAITKFSDNRFFTEVFKAGSAAVYAVR